MCLPECSAAKSETPSGPSTTVSPSSTKCSWCSFSAAVTISGKRRAQSCPPLLIKRTRPCSRISIIRYPSYFTSCSQSGPVGTLSALMGNANVYSILSAEKLRQSIDVFDLTGIAHIPPMRTLRQFVTQVRHGDVSGPYRSSKRSIRYCPRLPHLSHTRRTIFCLVAVSPGEWEPCGIVTTNCHAVALVPSALCTFGTPGGPG